MGAQGSESLTINLRETNSRLGLLLDALAPDSREPRSATPHQMAGLLSELMRAGECLRGLPPLRDAALEDQLNEYKRNVARLREMLPMIQSTLLWQRTRLEQERARVRAASDWARASRETL